MEKRLRKFSAFWLSLSFFRTTLDRITENFIIGFISFNFQDFPPLSVIFHLFARNPVKIFHVFYSSFVLFSGEEIFKEIDNRGIYVGYLEALKEIRNRKFLSMKRFVLTFTVFKRLKSYSSDRNCPFSWKVFLVPGSRPVWISETFFRERINPLRKSK